MLFYPIIPKYLNANSLALASASALAFFQQYNNLTMLQSILII